MERSQPNRHRHLAIAAIAAFCTYFCMYAFRKPFTVGTYEGLSLAGVDYKIVLVIAQVAGYTLSKFIGIRVVSERIPTKKRTNRCSRPPRSSGWLVAAMPCLAITSERVANARLLIRVQERAIRPLDGNFHLLPPGQQMMLDPGA